MSYNDIKKLFEKEKNIDVLSNENVNTITEDLESLDYVTERNISKNRYVPNIEYDKPENFAFYGSAEEYYDKSFTYIRRTYPYDGSLKERQQWHNEASDLDNFIFDRKYPRKTGFINFASSSDGWGTRSTNITDTTLNASYWDGAAELGEPSIKEYVLIKGGPNADPKGDVKFEDSSANIFNTASLRSTNLDANFDRGVTVEFWYKNSAGSWPLGSSTTTTPVVFDLWNGITGSSRSYGRLTLFFQNFENATNDGAFFVNCISGSGQYIRGFNATSSVYENSKAFTSIAKNDVLDGNWHHYAFTFHNSNNDLQISAYMDGAFKQTLTASGQALNPITIDNTSNASGMIATIGSSVAHPWISSLVDPGTLSSPNGQGWNKISGSIDEFRFWKTKRTSKQIGRSWFNQVGGGTNSDISNVDLGIYYKFNEGITGRDVEDKVILDYSGRISNGNFVGYNPNYNQRDEGSAINEAGYTEFKDPVIYSNNPSYIKTLSDLKISGSLWDRQNVTSMRAHFPEWILAGDDQADENLKNITQVMSSYLDQLSIMIQKLPRIKDVEYLSGSFKPTPFSDKKLSSMGFMTYDLFRDAEKIEKYLDRNEEKNYSEKVHNIKNFIYDNIYNNLTAIYKAKGNQKSLKQMLHTLGLDEDLFKINLYASNLTYEISDDFKYLSRKRKVLDFSRKENYNASVFQNQDPADSNSLSYISGSPAPSSLSVDTGMIPVAPLYEVNVLFPQEQNLSAPPFRQFSQISSSIFGVHTHQNNQTADILTWDADDSANFQVFAVRDKVGSEKAKFVLAGSDGSVYSSANLESEFYDIYTNEKWNLSVTIRPANLETADLVISTGSVAHNADKNYLIEFRGFNANSDIIENSFTLTSSLSTYLGTSALTSSTRLFVGAHITNFTGSIVNQSDVRIINARVWNKYLEDQELKQHALDIENYGVLNPLRNISAADRNKNNIASSNSGTIIPNKDSLALHWEFSGLTGSNSSGEFIVLDVSSGSASRYGEHGSIGNIIYRSHTGKGVNFGANTANIFDIDYIPVAAQRLPEILSSVDMIKVLEQDDEFFPTSRALPIKYLLAIEKSMYQTVSEEMIKTLATVKEFNNLIGQPVNRYRQEYKSLEKMRQSFFQNINNTPDIEKYINFYKWFDTSINRMLQQLIPASSHQLSGYGDTIESHVFERNKYWNKFPTLETKSPDIEGILLGVNEMLYDYDCGHAPLDQDNQNESCVWWKDRAERTGAVLTSGDSGVDSNKEAIKNVLTTVISSSSPTLLTAGGTKYQGSNYVVRNLSKPFRFDMSKSLILQGGPNNLSHNNTQRAYIYSLVREFSASLNYIRIPSDNPSTASYCECDPEILMGSYKVPLKRKLYGEPHGANGGIDRFQGGVKVDYESQQADLNLPFNIYSGSVSGGYKAAFSIPEALEITNLHHDIYGSDNEIPMQSPYTQQNVGGTQHRHQALNNNLSDTSLNRAEAWSLQASPGNEFRLMQPGGRPSTSGNEDHIDIVSARGYYRRDNVSKGHINIKNIKMTGNVADDQNQATSLLSPLYIGRSEQEGHSHNRLFGTIGNYRNNYEVVQGAGRDVNNLLWKDRNQYFADDFTNGDIEDSFTPSTTISGVVDHHLFSHNVFYGPFSQQDRNTVVAALKANARTADLSTITKGVKNRTIFNERFAAPGGPEVMSRGAMDGKSSTYSVYNSMNYRNTTVRDALNVLWTIHSDQFGTASIPTASLAYAAGVSVPSYHKINRNTLRRLELTNETADLESQFGNGISPIEHDDNRWVSHEIPRSDFQYSWITASAESTIRNSGQQQPFHLIERASGHAPASGFVSGAMIAGDTIPAPYGSLRRPAISFLSSSRTALLQGIASLGGGVGPVSEYVADIEHGYVSSPPAILSEAIHHPFVRINMIIAEPVATSSIETVALPNQDKTFEFVHKNLTGFTQRDGILDFTDPTISTTAAPPFHRFLPIRPSYFNTINFGRPGVSSPILGPGNPFWPFTIFWAGIPGHDQSGLPSSSPPAPGGGILFNGLMLERNGPYGYSSFKQIRAGENALNRFFRRENIISFISKQKEFNLDNQQEVVDYMAQEVGAGKTVEEIHLQISQIKGTLRERVISNVFEPPLVDRYKPFRQRLAVTTANPGKGDRTTLKYTHGNNQASFANVLLNESLNTFNKTPQLYNDIKTYYLTDLVPPNANPLDTTEPGRGMIALEYTECIYPKEKYTFLKKNRMRTNFETGFWRDARICEYNIHTDAPYWYLVQFQHPLKYGYDKIVFGRTEYNFSGSDGYDNVGGVEPNNGLFARRNSLGAIVTIHSGGEGIVPNANSSIWPLDARAQFTRTDGKDSVLVGTDPSQIVGGNKSALSAAVGNQTAFTPYQRIGKGFSGLDGAGELQNDYCIFHNGDLIQHGLGDTATSIAFTYLSGTNGQTAGLRAACLYNRRVPDFSDGEIMYPGDTFWDAGRQANLEFVIDRFGHKKCVGPFYDSYDTWAEDLNAAGQGYTIVPEYRMSEHIDDYLESESFPAKLEDEPSNWLELTGATISDISKRNSDLLHEDFVDVYTTTDFLKYFKILEEDHIGSHYPSRISLSCRALKKFLPYDGFYPASRTLQLATLFSQSYGNQIGIEGSQGNFRTMTTPLFAPGILYNSIKSGIAVDYPIVVSSNIELTGTAGKEDKGTPRILKLTDGSGGQKYNFDARLPFETIMQPAKFFNLIEGNKVVDSEPHPSATIDSTASLGEANDSTDPRYYLAMNNFLASTVEFFMEDSRLKTFISNPAEEWSPFNENTLYRMVITLHSSEKKYPSNFDEAVNTFDPRAGYHYGAPLVLNSVKNTVKAKQHSTDNFPNRIVMYERFGPDRPDDKKHDFYGSSFGPPIAMWDNESTSSYSLYGGHTDTDYFNIPGNSYSASYAPYTPPYYNGMATAVIDFFPPEGTRKYDLSDILEHSRITYFRECDAPWMTHDWGQNEFELTWASGSNSLAAKGAMQLSASIDLLGSAIGYRSVTLDQLGQLEGFGTSEDAAAAESWVISPKFECPIINFAAQSHNSDNPSTLITMPVSGSGAIAKGLWHQYSNNYGGRVASDSVLGGTISSFVELSIVQPALTTMELSGLPNELRTAKYLNPALNTNAAVTAVVDLAEHIGMKLDSKIDSKYIQDYKDSYDEAEQNPELGAVGGIKVKNAKEKILEQIQNRSELTAQLGQLATSKTIHEAVLAIPFTTDTNGQMNFYTFPKSWVDYSITKDLSVLNKVDPVTGEKIIPSKTIIDQVNTLKKYVLPPSIDFISNKSMYPYIMYIFEFTHNLTKEDLGLIWQNLPPKSLMDIPEPKLSVSTVEHDLFINEFFGVGGHGAKYNFPKKDIRWMVFKVKQRALKDYASITPKTTDEPEYRPWEAIRGVDPSANSYGYNWPYDFFSMVELVKMEAGITLTPGVRPTAPASTGGSLDYRETSDGQVGEISEGVPERPPTQGFPEETDPDLPPGIPPDFGVGPGPVPPFYNATSTATQQATATERAGAQQSEGSNEQNLEVGADMVIKIVQNNNRDV